MLNYYTPLGQENKGVSYKLKLLDQHSLLLVGGLSTRVDYNIYLIYPFFNDNIAIINFLIKY